MFLNKHLYPIDKSMVLNNLYGISDILTWLHFFTHSRDVMVNKSNSVLYILITVSFFLCNYTIKCKVIYTSIVFKMRYPCGGIALRNRMDGEDSSDRSVLQSVMTCAHAQQVHVPMRQSLFPDNTCILVEMPRKQDGEGFLRGMPPIGGHRLPSKDESALSAWDNRVL